VKGDQRALTLVESSEEREEESKLDGRSVITTDLSKQAADAQSIHDRYKDLAFVAWAFRTSKTVEREMRPIHVRQNRRTRGRMVVVMLAYRIIRELSRVWHDSDLTVGEAITELSTVCLMERATHGVVRCHIVPEPRESIQMLIEKATVVPPKVLTCRGVHVATRKKLPTNRKKIESIG
jgi:hypothetical protein